MECPVCCTENPANAYFCGHCGIALRRTLSRQPFRLHWRDGAMLVPDSLEESLPVTSMDRIARATAALWADTLYLCLEDDGGKTITSGLYQLANGTAQALLEIEPECVLLSHSSDNGAVEVPLVLLPARLGEEDGDDGELSSLLNVSDVVMLDMIWPGLRELLAGKEAK